MPAVSKAQRRAAALALQAKEGDIPVSRLKGAALQMYKSMTMSQLREYATSKEKGLPKRKAKKGAGKGKGKGRGRRR